ncbi:hypothetical protein SCE1572_04695 [Sorangium cellulosum So0157-2]|uniref:Uncharacterized protein n=1 Tax=Sorangium cellulosum So0157-2 TaxID=1254432 RepID=S4XPU1_SORCE|nr:hypothetical protein SCE1572_04695 [Sorangium cellulosum So0157-2]
MSGFCGVGYESVIAKGKASSARGRREHAEATAHGFVHSGFGVVGETAARGAPPARGP